MEQIFCSGTEAKKNIIKEINAASSTVKIAMAYFTDKDIAMALEQVTLRGIAVTVVLDYDPMNLEVKNQLGSCCRVVERSGNGYNGIMHLKFCIVDDHTLIYGTYNYTIKASSKNIETLHVSQNKDLISIYEDIFEKLVSGNKIEESFLINNGEEEDFEKNFIKKLEGHFDLVSTLDVAFLKKEAHEVSRRNDGSKEVFISGLEGVVASIQSEIDSNPYKIELLKGNINKTIDEEISLFQKQLDSNKGTLDSFLDNQVELFREQVDQKDQDIAEIKKRIGIEENKLNAVSSEQELLERNLLDLEKSIITSPFWSLGTTLVLVLTGLAIIYLSLFFASTIWKVFFEEAEILRLLENGLTPPQPLLFELNALDKIIQSKGVGYGLFASLFFLVPVLVNSLHHILPNKLFTGILSWGIGILGFDVLISILISQHIFDIESLRTGSDDSWSLVNAISTGEFWMIFLFGALPLLITKTMIDFLVKKWNFSNPIFVDRQKAMEKTFVEKKLIHQNELKGTIAVELEDLNIKVSKLEENKEVIRSVIEDYKQQSLLKKEILEKRIESRIQTIENLRTTFVDSLNVFNSKLLVNSLRGPLAAFAEGYYGFINEHYSRRVADEKISNLKIAFDHWCNGKLFRL